MSETSEQYTIKFDETVLPSSHGSKTSATKKRKDSQATGYMSLNYSVPTIELLRLFNARWLSSLTACIIFCEGSKIDARFG